MPVLEPWSNGQTEGQINRLKTLREDNVRPSRGDLLRARLMPLQNQVFVSFPKCVDSVTGGRIFP